MTLDADGAGFDPAALTRTARQAEAAGFDCLWLGDHMLWRLPILEPLSTISFLAGRTDSIRFGTGVAIAPLRHPLWLAKQIGTTEALIGTGRLRIGLGSGEYEPEFTALGIDKADRAERLEATIEVLRQLQTRGRVTLTGEHYEFEDAVVAPSPSAGLELWLGGRSNGAAIRAARVAANGWLGIFASPRRVAEVGHLMREHAIGQPPMIGLYAWARIGQPSSSESAIRDYVAKSYGGDPTRMRKYWLAGTKTQVREQILELTEAGLQYLVVAVPGPGRDHQLDAWAQVLEFD